MNDPLQTIADRVIEQAFSEGVENLSSEDEIFFFAWSYAGELDNGGHFQFFFNSAGDHTAETVRALQELGLEEHADLLRRAATLIFGDGGVPSDVEERNNMLNDLPESWDGEAEVEELDDQIFALGGGSAVHVALAERYKGTGLEVPQSEN